MSSDFPVNTIQFFASKLDVHYKQRTLLAHVHELVNSAIGYGHVTYHTSRDTVVYSPASMENYRSS